MNEQKVPLPWTPIEVKKDNNNIFVEVSRRKYGFENSFLPTSIVIDNNEFLSGSISLNAIIDEKVIQWTEQKLILTEGTEQSVAFVFAQSAESLIVNSYVKIEYDGFISVKLSLIPFLSISEGEKSVPKLEQLWIDIPVKKEFASLYHYWPNDKTSIIPAQTVDNSGALSLNGLELPFKPYVWIGWEEGGLGWCTESKENIRNTDSNRCIEYLNNNDNITVRIHLFDYMPEVWQGNRNEWTSTLKPVNFEMGFQATPVKAELPDMLDYWRVYHIGYNEMEYINEQITSEGKTVLDEIADYGVKWIVMHENWSVIQNYGLPEDPSRFKKFVAACHEHDIEVMTYFGYEFCTLTPGWHENAEQYLIKTPDGSFTGGWQRLPMQRDYMVCYRGGYSAEMIERVIYCMDEYGIDGIYTDGTYVPWECANEEHRCGYSDRNGVRHTTFPIFAVREHVKKLYEVVHARGGLIDTHQSSCCVMPTLAFCDSYLDGENIQSKFMNGINDFLSLETFRAEYMGQNLGIIPNFLVYTQPPDYTIQKVAGLTLLHNVHPRAMHSMDNLRYASRVWNLYLDFGTKDSKWYPYWKENCPVKSLTEGIYISVFEKKSKLLAIVVNLKKNGVSAKVLIPSGFFSAINAMLEDQLPIYQGQIDIFIEPLEPLFLLIQ